MLGFLDGVLSPEARASAEEHVAACGACAELVTLAAADVTSSSMRLPGPEGEGRPFIGQLQPGARVGRYQILGALGRGGMGEVYAAYHPDLDRRIALKVVQDFDGGSSERRSRLLREARAIARLSHPNVVAVHDAGAFGDRVFIAMELIDGRTIDQWLRAEPRTWQEILDVFVAAGRGLAAAHAAGVIHRDFKPHNVMIAKDGSVRVMDFGLARFAQEDVDEAREGGLDARIVRLTTITKTGTAVGTPAYMSPEQFRRESIDARTDQFSYCVALHEALFGERPSVPQAHRADGATEPPPAARRRAAIPGWLRAVLLRGTSGERQWRYPSMSALLAALERGRTRVKRRVSNAAVAACALIASAGAWRGAHGNKFACGVPEDRLGAIWTARGNNPRRQSIHDAFAATGRATAETSWERLSNVLDNYVTEWGAMYIQACEATHVRGEQSADVLDLRMSCLNDNLDQVRALTDALVNANTKAVSNAVSAARELTPVARCANVALLRSAAPLPREESKLREVQRLRHVLADIQSLWDIGDFAGVFKRTRSLGSEVEATEYKPLLAEFLHLAALAEASLDPDPTRSEASLRRAILAAQASRDDLTAAKVCATLTYVNGFRLGRLEEAKFWAGLAGALLDRRGEDDPRMRAWIDVDLGASLTRAGDFEGARALLARALVLKERSIGRDHPDYATSLSGLAFVLVRGGHAREALAVASRAIEILLQHADPDAFEAGQAYANQGEAFAALGQSSEAEDAFQRSLQNLTKNVGRMHSETAFALQGLGEIRLLQRREGEAIPLFQDALLVRQQPHADPVLAAESEFGLARALWESRRDRRKAHALATAARDIYRDAERTDKAKAVSKWLSDHGTSR